MRRKFLAITAVLCLTLTGCTKVSGEQLAPLMGLEWFTEYDAVKSELDDYELLDERENDEEKVPQKMQDYSGVTLYDFDCDLTLCFTDSGLIGLNYHDVERNQEYKDWYSTLELSYGLPTEESSGMASWFDNPLGKNTAIYLFNLEEGVQVSFYATADNPDKSYEKQEVYIPTPEIRTPVVPVVDTPTASQDESGVADGEPIAATDENGEPISTHPLREGQEVLYTNADGVLMTDVIMTDAEGNTVTDVAGNPVMTGIPVETSVTAATTDKAVTSSTAPKSTTTETTTVAVKPVQTEPETEPPVEDKSDAFLLNGLQFYGSPDSERRKMNSYTQLYEYRTEEPGQPWELIMEYENVSYLGKNCDGVLCFTSLGLVGVNYFDSNTGDYSYWVQQLTNIYGSPNETQYDYTAWSASPVGSGTMIYVFALEDGVQISFFADDTGSELA